MTKKEEEMIAHIESWKTSGLTQAKYCKKFGVSLGVFGFWRTKYLKINDEKEHIQFKPIVLDSTPNELSYTITYLNGVSLNVNSSISVHELSKLIRCLD